MTDKTNPASTAIVVTASNTTVLKKNCRSLYIGVSGDVAVETIEGGTPVVFTNVPVGVLPIGPVRVRATGTTATEIIGLW